MKCKKESTAQKAYLRRQLHRRRLVLFCRIFLFVFFLICWEMSARLGLIDAFIFSSPSRTVRCFLRMMQDKSILIHTGVTLYETLISFTLVILCGLIGAVLLWSSRNLSEILEPYLVMLNSLPKSALAPILIVWRSKPMAGRGDFIWRHVSLNSYGVCSEKHPDHRYHTGVSASRHLAKT